MKIILITGASTGIGLATAKRLLASGHFVILTARKESLGRFASADFLKKYPRHWIRALDVRDPNERNALINQIETELHSLDVLINNAAILYRSPIESAYDFECREQMLVNFHAPIELIKRALPLMRATGGGHIVNISSAAGFLAVPTMGLYSASKHALEAASEALFYELEPWNIRVTVVEPGFISSDAYRGARLSLAMERGANSSAHEYADQMNLISALIDRATKITRSVPDDVARKIERIIKKKSPPLKVTVTTDARAISFLKKFLPNQIFTAFVHHCLHIMRKNMTDSKTLLPRAGTKQSGSQ